MTDSIQCQDILYDVTESLVIMIIDDLSFLIPARVPWLTKNKTIPTRILTHSSYMVPTRLDLTNTEYTTT